MKRKLIVGVAIMTLTITTGMVAYATTSSPKNEQSKSEVYQSEISMDGDGILSFDDIDKDNLPDGVKYMDEISIGSEDAQSLPLEQ